MSHPLNISICNNNSAKTGLTVTDQDIRKRLIGSSKSVTSRPQNDPQMLQIETEESLPDFKSQSVTHRTDFPLLLLQIKINGGAVWQTSRSVTIWNPVLLLTVTERDKPLTPGVADEVVDVAESPLACPLADVAGLFAALPLRWGRADRRIVLLTACQLVWEAL